MGVKHVDRDHVAFQLKPYPLHDRVHLHRLRLAKPLTNRHENKHCLLDRSSKKGFLDKREASLREQRFDEAVSRVQATCGG